MPTFRLNKLVRDGIVANQEELGQTPHYRTLTLSEHKRELVRKIIEEAQELLKEVENEGDLATEIADIKEATDDLVAISGLRTEDITAAQDARRAKMGGFRGGIYIETLDLPANDSWVEYYRKEPGRFEEL